MSDKIKSLRIKEDHKKKVDEIVSAIHLKTGTRLTHDQYIQESNELMMEKYKILNKKGSK